MVIQMILCTCQMIPCLVNIPSWKDMSGSTERYVGRSGMGRVVSLGSFVVGRVVIPGSFVGRLLVETSGNCSLASLNHKQPNLCLSNPQLCSTHGPNKLKTTTTNKNKNTTIKRQQQRQRCWLPKTTTRLLFVFLIFNFFRGNLWSRKTPLSILL